MDCNAHDGDKSGIMLRRLNCSSAVLDIGLADVVSPNHTTTTFFDNDNVTAAASSESEMYFWLSAPIVTFMYACIFVVGVIGNLLVCYVVVAYKDMRVNVFHIFLANLSIADLLVVGICVPTAMVDVFSQEIWYLGEHMCKAVPFLEYSVTHLSVLTILAISFERFLAIIFPLKAQYISTRNRSLIIIAVIWLVAFSSAIPFALIAQYSLVEHMVTNSQVPTCTNPMDTHWKQAYLFTAVVNFFVIPFFILCGVYAVIGTHLIKDSSKSLGVATADISSTNMRARKQVVVMLATVVATFFVFLLPFRVLSLWTVYAPPEAYAKMGAPGWYSLLYFARIMFYLNSASNPLVLYAMSSKFRAKFQHILCCRPLPPSTQVGLSRSGTLQQSKYSVRTEYSSSFRKADFDVRGSSYSFSSKRTFTNGNGNHSVSSNMAAEEFPML
ncbi:putative Growth hormone secretagogue receptor type 1 [Hypsibius exemplaris]|uniref:Growth hormone secretagogue receptor type 1 n=1 Tax=Hypsibius exemplaris TaxID=2072580 RepID=A0A1W0XEP8_HYPEX|nr:putative Growth hormone secretagogue receptor type 1 [Hypsibius exemplaris]